jgi:DNA-binding transcriptional MerR regulator
MARNQRSDDAVKAGALAQAAGVLPSKIRYYVKEGLLHPVGQTPGGFFLFDRDQALARLKTIERMQTRQRLTLVEIKERLSSHS